MMFKKLTKEALKQHVTDLNEGHISMEEFSAGMIAIYGATQMPSMTFKQAQEHVRNKFGVELEEI